jgi:hypothetical protein
MARSVTRKGGKRHSTRKGHKGHKGRKGSTRRQRGGIGSGCATLSHWPMALVHELTGGKCRTHKTRKSRKGRKRMRGGMGAAVSVSLGAYKKLASK